MDRSLEQTSLRFFMCRKGLATLPHHRRADDIWRRALGMPSPGLQHSPPLWSWEPAGTCPAGVRGDTGALTAWQAHLCPPELPCSAHYTAYKRGPSGPPHLPLLCKVQTEAWRAGLPVSMLTANAAHTCCLLSSRPHRSLARLCCAALTRQYSRARPPEGQAGLWPSVFAAFCYVFIF